MEFSKRSPSWMLTWSHHTKIFDQLTDVTNVHLRQISSTIWKHIKNVTVTKNSNAATVIMKHTNDVNWWIIFKNTTQQVLLGIRKGSYFFYRLSSMKNCHHMTKSQYRPISVWAVWIRKQWTSFTKYSYKSRSSRREATQMPGMYRIVFEKTRPDKTSLQCS